MPRLHLLNKEGPEFAEPTHSAPGLMESGWWRMAIRQAESVIGHPTSISRETMKIGHGLSALNERK